MWRWRWCVTQSEQCLGGELGRWKMVEMGSEKHSYHHIISFPSWIWIWRDIAMFIRSFPVLRCLFSVLGGVAGVAWLGHRKSPLRERKISSKSYIFRASQIILLINLTVGQNALQSFRFKTGCTIARRSLSFLIPQNGQDIPTCFNILWYVRHYSSGVIAGV